MNQLVTNVRAQKWMEMIHNCKQSGLTISAWCRENGISENCYYYRQNKLRELMGSEASKFVEIHMPEPVNVPVTYNENSINGTRSAAFITHGQVVIGLTNEASEELIGRIMRSLHV